MSDNPRIEELRRRVQKDPASIAFAQLAEEYRRSGDFAEAAAVCRAGLERHPSYLSARVTLGRALIELKQYDEAHTELDYVLRSAPENLAAIRGLAEIHQRRGELPEALRQYQTALGIAKHDPELEESVHDLSRQLGTEPAPVDTAPEPSVTAVEIPETIIVPTETETETFTEAAAPDPLPSLTPELEAAADEFTKALQALDALSLDLPGETRETPEPQAYAPAPAPEPEPALEHFEMQAETLDEEIEQAATIEPEVAEAAIDAPELYEPEIVASEPAASALALESEPSSEEAVADELESWLDAIVLDRETRTSRS